MELSKTKATHLAGLNSKKMRERRGLFLAEGEKCVFDTIGAFPLDCIVATEEWITENRGKRELDSLPVFTASANVLAKISSLSTPPKVMGSFHLPAKDDAQHYLSPSGLHLLLDGIQDPGNFGTIIRTADWFGFDTVYASDDSVDLFNPKTIQATMGSLKRVKVIYCDLVGLLEKSNVKNVFGLLLDGKDISESNYACNGAIIMGNEGKGLSPALRNMVTEKLLIPPYNIGKHPESLNVAVATGITLSYFRMRKEN